MTSLAETCRLLGVRDDFAQLFGERFAGLLVAHGTVRHALSGGQPSLRDLGHLLADLPPIELRASYRLEHDRQFDSWSLEVQVEPSRGLVLRTTAWLVPSGTAIVLRGQGVTPPVWGERGARAGQAYRTSITPRPGTYDLVVHRGGVEPQGPRLLSWSRYQITVPGPSAPPPPDPTPPTITVADDLHDDGALDLDVTGSGFLADASVAVRLADITNPANPALFRFTSDRGGRLAAQISLPARQWPRNSGGSFGVGVSATDNRAVPRTGDPLWSNTVRLEYRRP